MVQQHAQTFWRAWKKRLKTYSTICHLKSVCLQRYFGVWYFLLMRAVKCVLLNRTALEGGFWLMRRYLSMSFDFKSVLWHVFWIPWQHLGSFLWPNRALKHMFWFPELWHLLLPLPGEHFNSFCHPRGHFDLCFGSHTVTQAVFFATKDSILECVWVPKISL